MIYSESLTEGSLGPLVRPLKVIQMGFLAKGASCIRGSRK